MLLRCSSCKGVGKGAGEEKPCKLFKKLCNADKNTGYFSPDVRMSKGAIILKPAATLGELYIDEILK